MRDLDQEELGSVYGAGGSRWCPPPKKGRGGKGGKGSSSSGRGGKGGKSGKGSSSS